MLIQIGKPLKLSGLMAELKRLGVKEQDLIAIISSPEQLLQHGYSKSGDKYTNTKRVVVSELKNVYIVIGTARKAIQPSDLLTLSQLMPEFIVNYDYGDFSIIADYEETTS